MYVGSANQLKDYDAYLLKHGYTIEQLIDLASDCLYPHFEAYDHVAIFVGPGNNGGDGLSLGLKINEDGRDVDFYYVGEPTRFSKGNRYYFKQCLNQGLNLIKIDEDNLDDLEAKLSDYDVLVDAFFGFGLNSSPRGMYQAIIDLINASYDGEIIAIDIPTGLNCNTGKPYPCCLYATKTIALTALKQGYLHPDSAVFTGEVVVETLDVEDVFMEAGLFRLFEKEDATKILRPRLFDGYKNKYGVDLLVVGSKTYKGAALMSAKACVYSGAGIVKVLSDESVNAALPLVLPEAIGVERPPLLRKEDFQGIDAILLGCGLGLEMDAERCVDDVLTLSEAPLVIDADGLTLLSEDMKRLRRQKRDVILTPHIGEFRRLCDLNAQDELSEKAVAFARQYHCVLVLKGPYTIVTNGQESYRIHAGNGAMAVGGMGDTLAGIITALLGAHYSALDAALLGCFLHGFAGDELAKKCYTVIPDQVSEIMPYVMKALRHH